MSTPKQKLDAAFGHLGSGNNVLSPRTKRIRARIRRNFLRTLARTKFPVYTIPNGERCIDLSTLARGLGVSPEELHQYTEDNPDKFRHLRGPTVPNP